jgi:hypothetical protein
MNKSMVYNDLVNSAVVNNHFVKAITPFSDELCDEYVRIFKELEDEGKITLEECIVQKTQWDKIVRVKGYIQKH